MLGRLPGVDVEALAEPDLDRHRQAALNEIAPADGAPDRRVDGALEADHGRDHADDKHRHGKRERAVERQAPLCNLARLAERVELGRVERAADDGVEPEPLDCGDEVAQRRQRRRVRDGEQRGPALLGEPDVLDARERAERLQELLQVGRLRVLRQAVDLDARLGRRRRRELDRVEPDVADLVDDLGGRPSLGRVVQDDGTLGEERDLDADDAGERRERAFDRGDAGTARPEQANEVAGARWRWTERRTGGERRRGRTVSHPAGCRPGEPGRTTDPTPAGTSAEGLTRRS